MHGFTSCRELAGGGSTVGGGTQARAAPRWRRGRGTNERQGQRGGAAPPLRGPAWWRSGATDLGATTLREGRWRSETCGSERRRQPLARIRRAATIGVGEFCVEGSECRSVFAKCGVRKKREWWQLYIPPGPPPLVPVRGSNRD
jgi:hypothetical protein